MEHTTIAVDLAKSVFQVAVSHRPAIVDEERRLSRDRFLTFFAQRPPATIVLEACGSAHYWARQLQPFGHAVRLLPPHDVRPYVRRNKTDRTDAKGLLEANRNEEIHPVPVKTIEHQAIASLHRLRSTWLATRTARLNTVRGLLREFGIFIPVGAQHVVPRVRALLVEPTPVPVLLHPTLAAACDEIDGARGEHARRRTTARRARGRDARRDAPANGPGVGLITATALVALVDDIRRFPSGRHFASFLGLTPRKIPARRADASARSASRATSTCACSSRTAPAPSCGTPRRRPSRRRCSMGACRPSSGAGATSRRRRRQQAGPDRLGRVDATTAVRG